MHIHIGNTIECYSNADVKPKIAASYYSKLHIEPTWNSKYQCKKVVALEEFSRRLMVVAVNVPSKGVHHILMGKPRHKLHSKECGYNAKDVKEC